MKGTDLNDLRKALGLTIKGLADDLSISHTKLFTWFRVKCPDLEAWQRILLRAKCLIRGIDPEIYNLSKEG